MHAELMNERSEVSSISLSSDFRLNSYAEYTTFFLELSVMNR
jgi:hypothetical protein